MATLTLGKREKFTFYMTVTLLVIAGAMYFGEQAQPFKIASNIGSYAIMQVSGADTRSSTRTKTPTTAAGMYVVKKGDTVWGISKKFGVHPEKLKFTNYLPNDGKIIVGQKLTIPKKG